MVQNEEVNTDTSSYNCGETEKSLFAAEAALHQGNENIFMKIRYQK